MAKSATGVLGPDPEVGKESGEVRGLGFRVSGLGCSLGV